MHLAVVSRTEIASQTILERVAQNDRKAVIDCLEEYGTWVWAIARKFSDSSEAAEELSLEIFRDIWKYSHRFKSSGLDELMFISLIARRCVRQKPVSIEVFIEPDNRFFRSFIRYAKSEETSGGENGHAHTAKSSFS